jgi:hypothetical protein
LPELQKLADDYADRGVELVTVMSGGQNLERARATATRLGLHAPVILPDAALMRTFHVDAVPWTVMVDRSGKASTAWRGGQGRATFESAVKERL